MRKQSIEGRYVLDTSAFFALIEDEDGADVIQDLLEKSQSGDVMVFNSFVSCAEVFYITYREAGKAEAQRQVNLMQRLRMTRVDSSHELGLIAGRLKANHRISFADAWVAATAMMLGAILVHKDPEFEELEGRLEMLRSPYDMGKNGCSFFSWFSQSPGRRIHVHVC